MKYTERYKIENSRQIRRTKIRNTIIQKAMTLIITLAMVGVFLGLGCLDNGNTKEATIFTLACVFVGLGTAFAYDMIWGEDIDD